LVTKILIAWGATLDRLLELRAIIDRADAAYHRPGVTPVMADSEYDLLKSELRSLDPTDCRLSRVGAPYDPSEIAQKVKHSIPMGSLDNTDGGIAGVPTWYGMVCKKLGDTPPPPLVMSLKVDGSSIAIRYEDGALVRAITRGNGEVGEDVTANAALFRGVPTVLPYPFTGTVRGEAVLHRAEFEHITTGLPLEDISNSRNTGNGMIGRDDGRGCELINFHAFNLVLDGDKQLSSETAKFEYLKDLGFTVPPNFQFMGDTVQDVLGLVQAHYQSIIEIRHTLPFDIDGLVVTLDLKYQQDQFITTDPKTRLRPKFSRAIKFPSYANTTKVTGVTVTVGHNKVVVPTLDVEKVRVGGIFVDSVIVTNYDTIVNQDIAIGDTITVVLAGDIIPNCDGVVDRPEDRIRIIEPTECPICGAPTTRVNRGKAGANLFCTGSDCTGAAKRKVVKWLGTSRKGLGILDLGDEILDVLWNAELVRDPADLYKLRPEQFENLAMASGIRVGHSRAVTICDNIQTKTELKLSDFLGSIGIDLLGARRAEQFIQAAGGQLDTLEDWLDHEKLSTIQLPGLGDTTRNALVEGLDQVRGLIAKLLAHGVTVVSNGHQATGPEIPADSPVAGRSFCFTGTRELLKETEAAGGVIKDDVSKGLQYLVQKDSTKESSKTRKAAKYGTKVISLDHLRAVLAGRAEL
jgi:DNA ligase (NAD+)